MFDFTGLHCTELTNVFCNYMKREKKFHSKLSSLFFLSHSLKGIHSIQYQLGNKTERNKRFQEDEESKRKKKSESTGIDSTV